MSNELRRRQFLTRMTGALLLLSLCYLGRGFYNLVCYERTNGAIDLHKRWVEQRYVYNGQNPYYVVELVAAERAKQPLPKCIRDNSIDPRIGPPYFRQGGYPPWAFITAALFVLPIRFEFAIIYFALANVAALALIFAWAYQIGRSHGKLYAIFLGTASLAVLGNYNSLKFGNYGILVNGLLIVVYYLVERHKPVIAGIVYGLAALKPQISGLFAISFLVRRQWKSLLAASAYILLASIGTWALTKTNPFEMLMQVQHLAQRWTVDEWHMPQEGQPPGTFALGYGTVSSLLMEIGVDFKTATQLAAGLGLLSTLVLMWLWRNGSTLTLFAIAATIGRLWAYHRPTDDVMLVFLLIALGKLVLTKRSPSAVFVFSLVGLSLWFPTTLLPYSAAPAVEIIQVPTWLFGLTVLLAWQPRSERLDVQSQ